MFELNPDYLIGITASMRRALLSGVTQDNHEFFEPVPLPETSFIVGDGDEPATDA